jgi:predicted small secreted protein
MKRLALAAFAALALSLSACDSEQTTGPDVTARMDGGGAIGSGTKSDSTATP